MHQQNHAQYTVVEHTTWNALYTRQIPSLEQYASEVNLMGIRALELDAHRIPDFAQINRMLYPLTGWTLYAVPGLIDNTFFFRQMHRKQFGATTWIRTPEQMDYLEEPDIFHDVFGHVPLLANTAVCEYLYGLASIANQHITNEKVVEAIARLYWYTIEFGLIRESGTLKIYGAGILSSIGETAYSLSSKPQHLDFDIPTILETPYNKDDFQHQYFVLYDMVQLKNALPELEQIFKMHYA